MFVQLGNLSNRPRVLQVRHGLALHPEDDAICPAHSDHCAAPLDCLHGIFYLKEMPIW